MYRFIQDQSQTYPVQVLCHTLGVNRSGYYDWRKPTPTPPSKKADSLRIEVDSAQQVKDLFSLHRRRYGSRRLVSELKDRGVRVSRDFVRKVLVANQLRPIQPRSFVPRTTDSRHTLGYSPNLLLDRPRPTGPNQIWVSYITAAADRLHPPDDGQMAVSGGMGRSLVTARSRLVSSRSHAG